MILNVISQKYRLDLVTRQLTRDEVVDFFAQIKLRPTMSVSFLNPFTNTWKTITAYRGDRTIKANHPVLMTEGNNQVLVEMFDSVSQALIEL